MATFRLILILVFSTSVMAASSEERALQLNEEMDYLMSVAKKPKVWSQGNLPPRAERSGPREIEIPGIENLENKYFTDDVSFQAAKSEELKQYDEPTEEEAKKSYRVDGTVPKVH
ncbi:MAG: hypothetical protein K2P81_03015 [Bacteriovoracaceae bacterium]|nr:hypothetical protein [Bacteriovoracaceae bacterium]